MATPPSLPPLPPGRHRHDHHSPSQQQNNTNANNRNRPPTSSTSTSNNSSAGVATEPNNNTLSASHETTEEHVIAEETRRVVQQDSHVIVLVEPHKNGDDTIAPKNSTIMPPALERQLEYILPEERRDIVEPSAYVVRRDKRNTTMAPPLETPPAYIFPEERRDIVERSAFVVPRDMRIDYTNTICPTQVTMPANPHHRYGGASLVPMAMTRQNNTGMLQTRREKKLRDLEKNGVKWVSRIYGDWLD